MKHQLRNRDFYKRALTKKLALMEKHPRRHSATVRQIRSILDEDRLSLDALRSVSRCAGLQLRVMDLERRAGGIISFG